jgi:hypothetical protein
MHLFLHDGLYFRSLDCRSFSFLKCLLSDELRDGNLGASPRIDALRVGGGRSITWLLPQSGLATRPLRRAAPRRLPSVTRWASLRFSVIGVR